MTESSAPKTIFLTGGSGLLGSEIVRLLVQKQHRVRALARSASSSQHLHTEGASVVRGDLETVEALDLTATDALIHAAAPVVFWAPWSTYQREIVDASIALYRRAAAQGVKRFVYISSESVMQGAGDLVDVDAAQPYADPPNSDYGKAKKAAEIALLEAFRESPDCELIILRPTFIWSNTAPVVQALQQKMRTGRFVWIDRGERPFEAVHVANVALAVESALEHGRPGACYLVTDARPYTSRGLLTALVQSGPNATVAPERNMPSIVANPFAAAIERIWRTLGIWNAAPPVSRFEVAFMAQSRRYCIDSTIRDLRYQPLPHQPGG
jgi:2-alkyl-3-oxoalkanoate reductase